MIIGMTSQTVYGIVNMNVYRPQRILQDAGVIPLQTTSEAAYVKLGWVLGHTKNIDQAKKMLIEDQVGEFTKRVDPRGYEDF